MVNNGPITKACKDLNLLVCGAARTEEEITRLVRRAAQAEEATIHMLMDKGKHVVYDEKIALAKLIVNAVRDPAKESENYAQELTGLTSEFIDALLKWPPPPIHKEVRALLELKELLSSDVFHKTDLLGDGRPVLHIPGLFAGDYSMRLHGRWLNRNGFHSYYSGFKANLNYTEVQLEALRKKLFEITDIHGKKAILVGHSLGGTYATLLQYDHPDRIEMIIAWGSPEWPPFGVNPTIVSAVIPLYLLGRFMHKQGNNNMASKEFSHLLKLKEELKVPLISIASESDGILDQRSSHRPDSINISVHGTHMGLGHNHEVYEAEIPYLNGAKPNAVA